LLEANKYLKYRILAWKPHGKDQDRWEFTIKMDLMEVSCDGKWMELAQDRVQWRALVLAVLNLQVPGLLSERDGCEPVVQTNDK
jgi:hypothetical protein